MSSNCDWIIPDWPAPPNIKALTTLRTGGVSLPPYDSLNLGLNLAAGYILDNPEAVLENRQILREKANLPNDPFWLKQVHSTRIINVGDYISPYPILEADGSVAFKPNQVCAITTADCLPILLCDIKGTRVSAVHAGWRGLAAGIVEAAVSELKCDPTQLMAWLGPALGPTVFEVREDVLAAFKDDVSSETFVPSGTGSWFANLYELARIHLKKLGVTHISGGTGCTYSEPDRFYSFRRSKITGRMATLIWMC